MKAESKKQKAKSKKQIAQPAPGQRQRIGSASSHFGFLLSAFCFLCSAFRVPRSALLPLALLGLSSGCFRVDSQLARVKEITGAVESVTEAGLTLDQSATPQQVVYALLQVLKEDARASGAAARQAILERELALAAPDEIVIRFNRRTESWEEPHEETILRTVRYWGAVAAYYVNDFEAPMDELTARMNLAPLDRGQRNKGGATELARVTLTLADPAAPDDRARRAILRVDLSKEAGYWRVCYVGFEPRPRAEPKKVEAETPNAG